MGSINPVFLMGDALAQRAQEIAAGLHQSVTLGVGQFCTNPGLVIAPAGQDLDRFVAALGKLIEATEPGTMLLDGILEAYEEGVKRLSKTAGVEVAVRASQTRQRQKTQCAAALFVVDGEVFLQNRELSREVFGPSTLVVRCRDEAQMLDVARALEGQLTATIHTTGDGQASCAELLSILETKAGRVLFGGFPTGVEVCPSMNHGGPYPATTDVHFTSVGAAAIYRFARPVCYQNFPQAHLPPELRDENERGVWRWVDGVLSKGDLP